ncbi:hypothetical protein NY2A_b320L [Paramecium bursaria Chlorella virus NY2A]|uniref:Uncharacterized protein b320L n=1 Tax=Paramecium bursaria Chlorella virus NY2A TaxID=46021 RepID=A7IWJ5_PBCVN|nr:hypothetical protein NY2A_b320L [Paramecium bursaria Chlorella virus NY2A]ABT14719.1 hypothetical protein NY2A_b320L [Paramecium bursaria Chlorella virus NY2A]
MFIHIRNFLQFGDGTGGYKILDLHFLEVQRFSLRTKDFNDTRRVFVSVFARYFVSTVVGNFSECPRDAGIQSASISFFYMPPDVRA